MNKLGRKQKPLGLTLVGLVVVCLGLMAVATSEDLLAMQPAPAPAVLDEVQAGPAAQAPGIDATAQITSPSLDYLTIPEAFPHLLVLTSTEEVDDGYLFWSARKRPNFYLLLTDNTGDPVYFYLDPEGHNVGDFGLLDNGLMSYIDNSANEVVIMDESYTVVRKVGVGSPFVEIDGHDKLLLSNGNMLIEVLDIRTIDMSQIVPGGYPTATVEAQVLQEIDADDNIVWEWNSWDYYEITDALIDLTEEDFGFVHINSMEEDLDGDIIISARRQDEVAKIDKATGDIVWRLGGPNNDFTLVGGNMWHVAQHDARRQPNGNLTLYDNRCSAKRTEPCSDLSRGLEYALDEVNMTAEVVWEFWNKGMGDATGNAQRLPNGNTLMGWGRSNYGATEVEPDDVVAFDANYVGSPMEHELASGVWTSYRVRRYPWQGCPTEPPTLIANYHGGSISLHYSWNGATGVDEWQVYGGSSPEPTTLLTTHEKTQFEHVTTIDNPDFGAQYYFRVLPVTSDGCAAQYSNEVSVRAAYSLYMPLIAR